MVGIIRFKIKVFYKIAAYTALAPKHIAHKVLTVTPGGC